MDTNKELSTNELYELLVKVSENQTRDLKEQIKLSIETQNKTIKIANEKLEKLANRCLYLERKSRKNNIIIFGLEIKEHLLKETITTLNSLLNLNYSESDINNIYKIGQGSNPPIVVEFISFLRKIEVFKDLDKLKKLKEKNIAISNDLCEEDRKEQKLLRKYLKEAREKQLNAKIRGNKLEINNILYTVNQLENGDINPENSSSDSEVDTYEEAEQENAALDGNHSDAEKANIEIKKGNKEGGRQAEKKESKQYKTPSPTLKKYRSTRKK